MTKPQNTIRPFGWADKIGYAIGDLGCGFSFQLVSTFMQLFYMQYIGIPDAAYGVIIILSKVFDAINDVVIGNLVDTKKIGKKSWTAVKTSKRIFPYKKNDLSILLICASRFFLCIFIRY